MMEYERQAKWFHALAHPTSLRILEILAPGPVCVGDLVEQTGKLQTHISRHLATLRSAGLVTANRQGWIIRYQLNPDKLAELEQFILELIPPTSNTLSAIFGKTSDDWII